MKNRFAYHLERHRRLAKQQQQQQEYRKRLCYALRKGLSPKTRLILARLDAEEATQERQEVEKRLLKQQFARMKQMAAVFDASPEGQAAQAEQNAHDALQSAQNITARYQQKQQQAVAQARQQRSQQW